ncbi:MAG: hypothetical protein V4719_10410 [Planctomycetota bacterium]
MSRLALATIALGLLSLATGCCSPCGGRGLTSYNYSPAYPTAYAPAYSTAYAVPASPGCSSCAAGVAPF